MMPISTWLQSLSQGLSYEQYPDHAFSSGWSRGVFIDTRVPSFSFEVFRRFQTSIM